MIEPYTREWWEVRLGKVTSSRIADVTARLKSGEWGASRRTYMGELIAEHLTGRTAPSYSNAAMEWGRATEPQALAAYNFYLDRDAVPCGWVQHPKITMAGGTPDAAIYGRAFIDGLVEVKCPNTTTHIETLRRGKIPSEYLKQCHWHMACVPTAAWVDFVSFDPRLPERLQLFVRRVDRDGEMITELEEAVDEFLHDLDGAIDRLWVGAVTVKDALAQSLKEEANV